MSASPEILQRITAMRQAIEPAPARISSVHHPDIGETWLHIIGGHRTIFVSFAPGDDRAYVVVHTPGQPRRVLYDTDAVITERLIRDISTWKDTPWPSADGTD